MPETQYSNREDFKILDPRLLDTDFPIVCLVSNNNNIVAWLIRVFSKGSYNHVCWLYEQGQLASQDGHYRSVPIEHYMTSGCKLKFYAFTKLTCIQRNLLLIRIKNKLAQKSRYDWLGIVGQATGLRFINNPWTNYCSESLGDDIRKVYDGLRKWPNPEDIDKFCGDPTKFTYLGHWIGA